MGLISAFLFFVWPASRSIREDDGLMSGDVVSTGFRFQGSPLKERQPDDFVRIRCAELLLDLLGRICNE